MLRTLMIFILLIGGVVSADELAESIEATLADDNRYRQMAVEFMKEFQSLKDSPMAEEGKSVAREVMKDKTGYIDNALKILEMEDLKESVAAQAENCIDTDQLGEPHIYIFISSSMPEQTLKNYADALAKLGGDGIMLLNGTIGDPTELKPTLDFITKFNCGKTLSKLQKNNERCDSVSRVDINPMLFRIFNVKEVPAIVWSSVSYAELLGMANMGESLNASQYGLIYGDVPVEYALERFSKSTLKLDIKPYMQKLKPGYFGGRK